MPSIVMVIFLVISPLSFGQDNINFGFGAGTGYKCVTNESGFLVGLRIKKHLDVYSALTFGRFTGFGYSFGVDVSFLERKVQPFLGVGFGHQDKSGNIAFGEPPSPTTIFTIDKHNTLVYSTGVNFLLSSDNPKIRGYAIISPYVSYRNLLSPLQAVKQSGPPREDIEESINKRIGSGLGLGIRFMYYFGDRNRE